MIKEALKEVQKNHRRTLKKLAEYEREHQWRA